MDLYKFIELNDTFIKNIDINILKLMNNKNYKNHLLKRNDTINDEIFMLIEQRTKYLDKKKLKYKKNMKFKDIFTTFDHTNINIFNLNLRKMKI